MRFFSSVLLCFVILLSCGSAIANTCSKMEVYQHLRNVSVTTVTEYRNTGSGVIVTREIEGKKINFAWSVAHVYRPMRTYIPEPIEEGDEPLTVAVLPQVKVFQLQENGEQKVVDALIIAIDPENDLCVLMLNDLVTEDSVGIHKSTPELLTPVYHMGAFHGPNGEDSFTEGEVVFIGREAYGHKVDQVTAICTSGSSGGGFFLTEKAGEEAGVLVGLAEGSVCYGAGLMIPARTLVKWAEENNLNWMVDTSADLPTLKELEARVITEIQLEK